MLAVRGEGGGSSITEGVLHASIMYRSCSPADGRRAAAPAAYQTGFTSGMHGAGPMNANSKEGEGAPDRSSLDGG
jgi:hypothetical protein